MGGVRPGTVMYASDLVVPLVTKDGRIRAFARSARDVRVIW
ncbi:MAG: hypothetical protein ACRDY7_09060 [Acidimicrobiia bacterium]